MTEDEMMHQAACIGAVCDPARASNPVAWFDLEQAGITRELMRKMVDAGEWAGSPPIFDAAPDRDGPMWRFMASKAKAASTHV